MDLEIKVQITVDELIRIKDRHRDILMPEEINALNDACNLLYKNRKLLKKK